MLTGTGSLSISKKDLQNQKIPAYGMKKIVFAHKATSGDTSFNTSNLTAPSTEMPGFVQASASDITAANLLTNRRNLTITSSLRGPLIDYMSYNVVTNSQISFSTSFGTAEDGEIFYCVLDSIPKQGVQLIDGSAVPATGTLSAGTVNFSFGTPVTLNLYPTQQIGAYLVYLDGALQVRNTGNAAASLTADGNYHENDSGSNLTTSVTFNVVDNVNDRSVVMIPNGMLISRPNDSMLATIESLSGQLDQVIADLALATGNPTTKYQSAPNNVNLKGFGDRVFNLETNRARIDLSNIWSAIQAFPGITDASSISAGKVGETTVTSITDSPITVAADTFVDSTTTITLQPGKYRLEWIGCMTLGRIADGADQGAVVIRTGSTIVSTYAFAKINQFTTAANVIGMDFPATCVAFVNISVATTYKLSVACSAANTTCTVTLLADGTARSGSNLKNSSAWYVTRQA